MKYFKQKSADRLLKNENVAVFLLAVFYSFGVLFHILPNTKQFVVGLTEPTLYLSNGLVLLYLFKQSEKPKKLFFWIVITLIITLIVEIVGVATGKIFGVYHYGETIRLKIFKVPFIIGVNWAVLILASFQISSALRISKYFQAFIAGAVIVIFDFVMEPIAVTLDYWKWTGGFIPTQNYIAWFFLAVAFSFLLIFYKIKISSKILVYYFIVQFLFFSLLRIFYN